MEMIIQNVRAITPQGVLENASVAFENGKITRVGQFVPAPGDAVLDGKGLYLAPGFIDIHTHGAGGCDYMDGTAEAAHTAAVTAARFGATAVYPTSVCASEQGVYTMIDAFFEAQKISGGAQLLGIHLEGSYFDRVMAGAQDPRYIVLPDEAEYRRIYEYGKGSIKRWSAAPELPGAMQFGDFLKEKGIVGSMGHTDADTFVAIEALEHGYSHCTHLYSAMSGVRRIDGRRHGGVVEAAFLSDDITVEMICDGVHLPKELLQLIYKIKGPDKVALVTDSMRAAGQKVTKSILGSLEHGQEVLVDDEVAWMPDRTSFAGSICTCDRLVRTAVKLAEIPLADAVKMMTLTPARIMGIDAAKGSIEVGKDADLVLFDEDIRIERTIVGGETVYQKD